MRGGARGRAMSEPSVLVPAEPTDEMVEAGLRSTAAHLNIPGSGLTVAREKMRIRYRAMVAAAASVRAASPSVGALNCRVPGCGCGQGGRPACQEPFAGSADAHREMLRGCLMRGGER